QLADYEVKPVISKLGPKYGAKLREIQAELARVDGKRVVDGQPLVVAGVELLPDEVEVRTKDRPGLAVATEDGLTIAVDTTLTPELVLEGHARELVHRIQTMRKAADYQIDERIVTYYEGGPTLDRVVAAFGDYVKQETLSRDLRPGVPETADHAEEFSIDGDKARIAVARADQPAVGAERLRGRGLLAAWADQEDLVVLDVLAVQRDLDLVVAVRHVEAE